MSNPSTPSKPRKTRVPVHMDLTGWSKHLGVSKHMVRNALYQGEFPNHTRPPSTSQTGGKILIPETDIELWLAKGKKNERNK